MIGAAWPVHGVAFVFYVVTFVDNFSGGVWLILEMLCTWLACFAPFGAFLNERYLAELGGGFRSMIYLDLLGNQGAARRGNSSSMDI